MMKIVVTFLMLAGLLLNVTACTQPVQEHSSNQSKTTVPADLGGGGGGGGGGGY